MKKIVLLVVFVCSQIVFSQDKIDFKRNELKINAAYLIGGLAEVSYERLLDNESGCGAALEFSLISDSRLAFQFTPYYRYYFGKKPAAGFFVDGFAMLNTLKGFENHYYYNSSGNYVALPQTSETYSNFALGFDIGSKWITRKGFLFEISGGIGRNLTNTDKNSYYDTTVIPRGAVTVGYRF